MTPELRDRLLYYAWRAPSPHNAQGWRIDTDGLRFRVSRDPAHQVLEELDPQGRESDFACGAVVTNLCVAARAFGFGAAVQWRPAAEVAADVTLVPGPDRGTAEQVGRLRALRLRAMNRSHYRHDPVPQHVLDTLRGTARRSDFTLAVLTDPAAIHRVAAIAGRAGALKLRHGPTQAEVHSLLRFNPRSAARRRDGLDVELFFEPAVVGRASAVAMHPRVVRALAPVGLPGRIARRSEEAPLRSAPALCLLWAESLQDETFLQGGACFEEIALDVTQAGLALALHSGAIEVGLSHPDAPHDSVPRAWHRKIAEICAELRSAFDVPPTANPVALFRLGSPTREPERRSLRRGDRPHARVLVASDGAERRTPVESLVRAGVRSFVLCTPGRADVEAQAARIRAIDSGAEVLLEPNGVTDDELDWLVGTTDVVIDGIDPACIAARRALHREAWRHRRPVVTASGERIYTFDYRNGRIRPFDGRVERLTPRQAVSDPLDVVVTQLVSELDSIGAAPQQG